MSASLRWYLDRLRMMSAAEVAVRTGRVARRASWRLLRHRAAPSPSGPIRDAWSAPDLAERQPPGAEALLREAKDCLQGRYVLAGVDVEEPTPDWHHDPDTGCTAPRGWAYRIDVRDRETVGNVKTLWERSQHHHIVVLALAHRISGQPEYAEEAAARLRSWVRENPILEGANWASPLELGVRLLAWVWIERLLRGSPQHGPLFGPAGLLWPSIYWHQRVLVGDFSYGSSANDHLIGEMAGLLVATLVWPVFRESERWGERARQILEREVHRQTFPSGVDREQAFGYHLYSTGFFLLAGLEAARVSRPLAPSFEARVRAMVEIVGRMRDADGHLPRWGDADDALPLQLQARNVSLGDWIQAVGLQWPGAAVEEPGDPAAQLAVAVLDPPEIRLPGAARSTAPSGSDAMADAGVYVLASRRGTPEEILCTVDAGPMGLEPLYAHAHADALGLTLSAHGQPILVDPGTYTYHSDPRWRRYFRGTSAHNTVVVDGFDQAESGGPFLWVRPVGARALRWAPAPGGGVLDAAHDGYERLSSPVRHERCVSLDDRELVIEDRVMGAGIHSLEWRWHLHPGCRMEFEGDRCHVIRDGVEVDLWLDDACEWDVLNGSEAGGWFSSCFGRIVPSSTLRGRQRAELPARVVTRICVRARLGGSDPRRVS